MAMTYTPIDDEDYRPPVVGSSAAWTTIIANDAELYELYAPSLQANPAAAVALTAAREFRIMWLGNLDANPIAVAVRASATAGPETFTFTTSGVDTDTDDVTTDDWYGVTLDARGPEQEIVISVPAPTPDSLTVTGVRASLVPAAPVVGTLYPSGWRGVGSIFGVSGRPIPSEIQSRLRTNPGKIAIDRPVCVFAHITDTVRAPTAKSPDLWGAHNHDRFERVGIGMVPRCDVADRWFRVYAYTTETVPRVSTLVSAASDGDTLPQSTINVDSTTGFASSGKLVIVTANRGRQTITYTGTTATTLTGCSGGVGDLSTGDEAIQGGGEFSVRIGSGGAHSWAGTGWHSWRVKLPPIDNDVFAQVRPGYENGAAIRTLLVWRSEL